MALKEIIAKEIYLLTRHWASARDLFPGGWVGDGDRLQNRVSCRGVCFTSPREPSCPKAALAEALLAISGSLIIQTFGDKREREKLVF